MKCQYPGCSGTIEDGFCDTCGRAPAGAPHLIANDSSNGAARPATTSTSTSTSSATSTSSSRRTSSSTQIGTTSRRRAGLGAGLVDLPPVPAFDPLQAVLTDPKVPDRRRLCPALVYRAPNGDLLGQAEARARGVPLDALEECGAKLAYEAGFCPQCGQAYSFKPSLVAGDVVDRKYEVKGPIAFGGLGWIYLAWAKHLARWVVIKGLLNIKDETQRELARAEARSLSAFKHPNIVQVYDLIEGDPARGEPDYIVMEYVGGKTLMQLRKERGPLPLDQACAYILGILPAFSYMHQQGRVYMDFKPENAMLEPASGDNESERIALIDMGAVHQAYNDDPSAGALYATTGYSSPEGAPTPQHDIYTIGRSLAVLTADFKFGSEYRDRLPAAADVPAWGAQPAFYALLAKATRADPDARFQSATELEDQLRGVLRLVVAATRPVPPAESSIFSADILEVAGADADRLSWRSLPVTRTNPADPAAPVIEAANRERDAARATMLRSALGQPQYAASRDLQFQVISTLIEQIAFADADVELATIEAADPFDWRVRWVRGKLRLAQLRADEARRLFEQVDAELPGELAPKLACAVAAETAGDLQAAASLYDIVSRTNPSFTTATFGLARCRSKLRDRAGAVAAYERVPATSSRYVAAQLALARALIDPAIGPPSEADLTRASDILEGLQQEAANAPELHQAAASLFLAAAAQLEGGHLKPNGTRLLGRPCTPADLRRGAEERLRRCARFAQTDQERIALIDRANAVRPWSVL